jgi:hypothetical protein
MEQLKAASLWMAMTLPTLLEKLARDKNSMLLPKSINYSGKNFLVQTPRNPEAYTINLLWWLSG